MKRLQKAALAAEKCAAALAGNFAERRLQTDWQATGDVPRAEAKLAFLLAQCAETAMPRGGTLRVMRDGVVWVIDGETKAVADLPELWSVLRGEEAAGAIGSAQVQFLLARITAAALGRRIEVDAGETRLCLRARPA